MENSNNNPKDVPQVKTVDKREEVLSSYHLLGKLNQHGLTSMAKTAMDDYSYSKERPLLDRISEIEARNAMLMEIVEDFYTLIGDDPEDFIQVHPDFRSVIKQALNSKEVPDE